MEQHRFTPQHDADLRWYFGGASDAALGCRSNWDPLCGLAQTGINMGGASQPGNAITEKQVEAVARERRIATTLATLTKKDRIALFISYGPFRRREQGLMRFGYLAPLALHTRAARRGYANARAKGRAAGRTVADWLDINSRHDDLLFAAVYREAHAQFVQATLAYAEAAHVGAEEAA